MVVALLFVALSTFAVTQLALSPPRMAPTRTPLVLLVAAALGAAILTVGAPPASALTKKQLRDAMPTKDQIHKRGWDTVFVGYDDVAERVWFNPLCYQKSGRGLVWRNKPTSWARFFNMSQQNSRVFAH